MGRKFQKILHTKNVGPGNIWLFKDAAYFKIVRAVLIFTVSILSIYLLDNRPKSISITNAFFALGITWLGLLPSLLYLLDRNRPPMPFFPLVGLFYATNFGLPIFASDVKLPGRFQLYNVSSTALVVVLLGIVGMLIAFFASKSSLWKNVSPIRLPGPFPLGKLLTVIWILLIGHIAFLYLPSLQNIPSLGQFLDPVGYVAYGIFYIIWARRKLPSIQVWLLLGVFVPLEVIKGFATGSLAQVMLLGLFIMIVIWYERKRIPLVLILVTALFLVTFNSVKLEYRYLTWVEGRFSLNSIEKVFESAQLFVDLAIKYHTNPPKAANDDESPLISIIGRTGTIAVFSQVIEDTPTRVNYWGGETYLPLFTKFIPRFLWPDKPTEIIANQFGRRYGYLAWNDFYTAFNLPWIIEMYVNFGTIGVLAGMPLVGVLLAFIEQKLNNPKMNPMEFVIGATVMFRLFYQESNFSLMAGNVLNLSACLYILFHVFLVDSKQNQ